MQNIRDTTVTTVAFIVPYHQNQAKLTSLSSIQLNKWPNCCQNRRLCIHAEVGAIWTCRVPFTINCVEIKWGRYTVVICIINQPVQSFHKLTFHYFYHAEFRKIVFLLFGASTM